MQFKLAFVSAALATLAVATPAPRGGSEPASSCSTGPLQCCNTVTTVNDPTAATLIGLLGIVIQDVTALVGLTCSGISLVDLANGGCSAQAVCCQDNSHGGLISVGCIPVTV
ncbi:hypothetical protein D9757_012567 [Collybiopsis confluens]|uniref:Hydrophobin n=1 Tax=Collybiopsis confluens TaxID=2823264 RepID=A0A8H5G189_9AGAR|nr:hypothetical protein D9757_012567 [Collybiopsis confluens]